MSQHIIGEVTDVEVVQIELYEGLGAPLWLRDQRQRQAAERPGLETKFRQWRHSQETVCIFKM